MRADLVILDANPLISLHALRAPRAVVANGQIFDRAGLDVLQRELETEAAQ